MAMTSDLKHIYLSDHSAMMTAEIELIHRCRDSNKSVDEFTQLVDELDTLSRHVQEEQDVVRVLLQEQGESPDVFKELSGWVVEKIGRLKLNGKLSEYSDLSRVLELEILLSSAQSRTCLWKTLHALRADDLRCQDFLARTVEHVQQLNTLHQQASQKAFS
ncbi:MAG: hypothetical protein HUJ26_19280 [Planctomycetaceae bacterium]|nr:hypothetical protein [Planctomycetaceae bacterium]